MKHLKDLFSILALLLVACLFNACSDDEDSGNEEETILSVSEKSLNFSYQGEEKVITVEASDPAFVISVTTGDDTWAHVTKENQLIKVKTDENVEQEERSTTLTVKLNEEVRRVRISQEAAPAPEARPKTFKVPTIDGTDKTFVYKLMDGETQVGEVCREYLSADNMNAQAIVVYPVIGNLADLTRGYVVSVLDQIYEDDKPTETFDVSSKAVHGGSVTFDKGTNSISNYTAGTKATPAMYLSISNTGQIQVVDALTDDMLTAEPIYTTDICSNDYGLVKIGTQYWMQSNLKTTKRSDGTDISTGITGDSWTSTPIYRESCMPENVSAGFLYNAVACGYSNGSFVDAVSPEGFTIPSNAQWNLLVSYLSKSPGDAGSKLKVTGFEYWNVWDGQYIGGTNVSGFSAYGIGYGNGDGTLAPDGSLAHVFYLSSTTYDGGLGRFNLNASGASNLLQDQGGNALGYGIRCVRY